jgi:hypothetical protein
VIETQETRAGGTGRASASPQDSATYDQFLALTGYRRSLRAIDPSRDIPTRSWTRFSRWPGGRRRQAAAAVKVRGDPRRRMRKRISDLYARQMADKREMQEAGSRSAGQSAAGGSARHRFHRIAALPCPCPCPCPRLGRSARHRRLSGPDGAGERVPIHSSLACTWERSRSRTRRPGHRPHPPRGRIAGARVAVDQRCELAVHEHDAQVVAGTPRELLSTTCSASATRP